MRSYSRSFAGGEVAPELFGRIDNVRFQTGLALARNFITLPHGPARNRPGFELVSSTLDPAATVRLIGFTFSSTQTNVIVLGAVGSTGFVRFMSNGAMLQVTDGGVPAAYKPDKTFAPANVNTGTWEITIGGGHGLVTGDPIRFTIDSGSALPAPLVVLTKYYAIRVSSTVLKVATSYDNAIAGTPIHLTTTGTGTAFRINYAYGLADLVEWGGDYFYCLQSPVVNGSPSVTPVEGAYWHQQPATGEYEIPSPFAETDLADVRYAQTNDVVTLVHPSYTPVELTRVNVTRWKFSDVSFSPTLSAPTGVSAVATQAGIAVNVSGLPSTTTPLRVSFTNQHPFFKGDTVDGTITQGVNSVTGPFMVTDATVNSSQVTLTRVDGTNVANSFTGAAAATGSLHAVPLGSQNSNTYVVTAIAADGTESLASSPASVTNNLYAEGAYNTVSWSAVTGAVQYRIYRKEVSLYGLLGTADASSTSFLDRDNLGVDLSIVPKLFDSDTAALKPSAVCYHEQRRVFALNQDVWATRSNTDSDLTFTLPVKDDDRLLFQIAATEYSGIAHLVSLGELLALTTSAEFVISSPDSVALTPSSLMSRPHSFVGASRVRPAIVNNSVLFVAARGGHVREVSYSAQAQGFVTTDLSLHAVHLFDGYSVADLAVQRAPYQVAWTVSSSGTLLGLTYVPEQEVQGWHQHPMADAVVESVASVSEGAEDGVYIAVRRTVNGSDVLYLERMASLLETDIASMVYVDSAVTVLNASAGQLAGFDHLIGETVSILADGVVLPQQAVNASGEITLARSYSTVTAGLPIDAALQTLPLVYQIDGLAQGQTKNVNRVWIRVDSSSTFKLGPSVSALVPSASADPAPRALLTASALSTGRLPVTPSGEWTQDGQVYVQQPWPLPLTVLGITIDATIGG